ncbi:MAG TPA: hypothetical protein VGN00_16650 [Puia sp.]
MRRTLVSSLLIAVVGFTFASKGGGGEKNKAASIPLKTNFTPIRTTNGFTLKAGPTYTGSYLLGTEKTSNYVSFNTLITYQKGNSTYILPYQYKMNSTVYLHNSGSNLRLLDLRVNLHK